MVVHLHCRHFSHSSFSSLNTMIHQWQQGCNLLQFVGIKYFNYFYKILSIQNAKPSLSLLNDEEQLFKSLLIFNRNSWSPFSVTPLSEISFKSLHESHECGVLHLGQLQRNLAHVYINHKPWHTSCTQW